MRLLYGVISYLSLQEKTRKHLENPAIYRLVRFFWKRATARMIHQHILDTTRGAIALLHWGGLGMADTVVRMCDKEIV